jgi:hypothetical protein
VLPSNSGGVGLVLIPALRIGSGQNPHTLNI